MKKNISKIFAIVTIILMVLLTAEGVSASQGPRDFDKSGVKMGEYSFLFGDNGTYFRKDDWTTQRIYLSYASTSLANPCNSCQYAIRAIDDGGDWSSSIVLKIATHGQLDAKETQASPGRYNLQAMRSDVTLMSSRITGTWWID